MTFAQLYALLATRLQDTSYVRWALADMKSALNVTYEDFCSRSECVQALTTLVQSSGAVYFAGAAGATRIVRLLGKPQSATLKWRLEPITADEAFDMNPDWETETGDPEYFIFPWTQASGIKTLRVVYTPSSALTDLKVMAVQLPAQLSGDSDVPATPPEYHDCLVDGAMAYLLAQPGRLQNLDLARVYDTRYEGKLAQLLPNKVTGFSSLGASVPYGVV